jgi:cytochrome P450
MKVAANKSSSVYWDPYRPDLGRDPYPTYQRLREEAPLYYNEQYDFYALSRFSDIEEHFSNTDVFGSARSNIIEYIRQDFEVPDSMFIWQDPPLHTTYRSVVSRVFTPKRMNDLEGQVRDYCIRCLAPLEGSDRFDFIADLGAKLPGGVIGMLLGIPDTERDMIYERVTSGLRTEEGKPMVLDASKYTGENYEDYLDWRIKNPSDDLMTMLLQVEFDDVRGNRRKLTREEILLFVSVLAGAGNETTSRLIGWMGRILGDHPDQRRQIVENPALVRPAIEEILRFEPPGPSVARYVKKTVTVRGQTVPEGSVMLFLLASANRDEARFPDGDCFDIHRVGSPHITFARGIHSCLGAALARVEGRVALEEILKRFPEWTVDEENAKLASSSTTRGWDTLPAFIP